jgi:SAM-dependent methyltransferase
MKEAFLDTLVCQQCLARLSLVEGKLMCNSCRMEYPISKGLIFMGHDENEKDEVEKIISTERDHQTDLNEMEKHYSFAYPSFRVGLMSIDILRRDVKRTKAIAVDIGSGISPMSLMLSENGFDAYRCELDPNSLYYGLFWKHPGLDLGKHIVCDATYLPFRDGSVDVVFSKEFVHHVSDYHSLFMEINRVLKKGGVLLMIDGSTSVIYQLFSILTEKEEHYGHHTQTMKNYLSALRSTGFMPYRYYLYHLYNLQKYVGPNRMRFLHRTLNLFHTQMRSMSKTSGVDTFLKMSIQRLIDGSHVVFLRKTEDMPTYRERPRIQTVEPSNLILDENYLNDPRLEKFSEILSEVRESTSGTHRHE